MRGHAGCGPPEPAPRVRWPWGLKVGLSWASPAVGRLDPFLAHQKLRNGWLVLDLLLGHLGVGGTT